MSLKVITDMYGSHLHVELTCAGSTTTVTDPKQLNSTINTVMTILARAPTAGLALTTLIKQFDLAADELLKGNPEPVKKWFSHRQDVTLGNPLGPFARGWEQAAAVIDHAASQVRDDEMVEAETVTSHVTPELAYLVRVERSQAKFGGQDAVTPSSLRVTMIMAPEDGAWKIVHRHADPITTARPIESVIQQ